MAKLTIKDFVDELVRVKSIHINYTHPAYALAKAYTSPTRNITLHGISIRFTAYVDGTFVASIN